MSCPTRSCRRMGFSLVELLAVVGIIALLISILVPSLNMARKKAKATASLNTIHVIQTGVEAFKADMTIGGAYPESGAIPTANPHVPSASFPAPTIAPTGASLLVWALAGADLLGTPGFRNLDGDANDWRNDTGTFPANPSHPWPGLYAVSGNGPAVDRHGPFVAMENMKLPKNVGGSFVIEKYNAGPLNSVCFLDSFERPILYYRANPAGAQLVQKLYSDAINANTTGMYYLQDNMAITGWTNFDRRKKDQPNLPPPTVPGLDLGRGSQHLLGFFPQSLSANELAIGTGLGYSIVDRNITAVFRPQRPDTYLLLSAGPDGRYGTSDDIGNFNVSK